MTIHLSSHELARRRAFDPSYPTFLGCDDKLQRLIMQSYEIVRIENPNEKNKIWDKIIDDNGIRKSDNPATVKGFVTARNPKHGWFITREREELPKDKISEEFLLLPEELAFKMMVLECPILRTSALSAKNPE